MAIPDLPQELVCDILSILEADKSALTVMSGVSRTFHQISQRYLYGDVSLAWAYDSDHEKVHSKTAVLFETSLERNPALARSVRRLAIVVEGQMARPGTLSLKTLVESLKDGLTELSVTNAVLDSYLDLFAIAPSLQRLELDKCRLTPLATAQTMPPTNSIDTLEMIDCTMDCDSLPSASFPRLSNISFVDMTTRGDASTFTPFSNFFTALSPAPTTISIYFLYVKVLIEQKEFAENWKPVYEMMTEMRCADEDLKEILDPTSETTSSTEAEIKTSLSFSITSSPNLTSLLLYIEPGKNFLDQVAKWFESRSSTSPLFPNLETIQLYSDGKTPQLLNEERENNSGSGLSKLKEICRTRGIQLKIGK